ncbi:MAG: hypothetical protein Q4F66_01085 [Clostridium sp.]|nr:hypothetical protein [Clostridium sp.]
MGYSVIDLLEKCIQIENIKIKYLEDMIEKKRNETVIQIVCRVFSKDCLNTITFYNDIKESIDSAEISEINVMTYDKMSFLFNEFIKKIYIPDLDTPRKYLLYALDLAKDKHSLFVDIQGRLYNDSKEDNSVTYKVLTKLVKKSEDQIRSIERTLL